jgi:hypothetical protein
MAEPFAPHGPEPADDALATALEWLRGAVAQQEQDVEKRLDVFDCVCMRLVRALSRGVEIRSLRGFLASVLPQQVEKLAVQRAEDEAVESQIPRVSGELPEKHRRWLQGWLAGLSDEALAERKVRARADGVCSADNNRHADAIGG